MKYSKKRTFIQLAAAVFANGYLSGFMKGRIFKGRSKMICVPMLNCYSCPGALGACPIGALQAVISDSNHKFSFYILGTLMLFGVLLGRFVCGFLCLFGFLQDLLYKIPIPKLNIPRAIDKPLRYVKYIVLIVIVLILPMTVKDEFGIGSPFYCKYLCPAGTLEGGIPLVLMRQSLQILIGDLFDWKMTILIVILILSIIIYRPFCKYICPLGAVYSLFNSISFYRLGIDKNKCVDCKLCEKSCLMNVQITKKINSPECIRCGKCIDICPQRAIYREKIFKKIENNHNLNIHFENKKNI